MRTRTKMAMTQRLAPFFFWQVGIAKEKVVSIGRLSELAAAELFVASAPREVCSPLPAKAHTALVYSTSVREIPPSVSYALLPCNTQEITPSRTISSRFSPEQGRHTQRTFGLWNMSWISFLSSNRVQSTRTSRDSTCLFVRG